MISLLLAIINNCFITYQSNTNLGFLSIRSLLDLQIWMFGYQPAESGVNPARVEVVPHSIISKAAPVTAATKASVSVTAATKLSVPDFAYAYVVGGCNPSVPAYRNFINNILINTYLQRSEGSKADVIVFFQMSYDSGYDELPDSDVRVLTSMSIRI